MVNISMGTRLKHAWNAFRNRDPTGQPFNIFTNPSHGRPDRTRLRGGNERSIVNAIYNRIAIDVAATRINHCRLDDNDKFKEVIYSGLNSCISESANLDQTSRAFILDVTMSLFDEGCIAVVPVDTTINPKISGSYDIQQLRTGRILEWFPSYVRVSVYNEIKGEREEITLPKHMTAIIENPLYAIMNEPNGVLQRLIRKLNLLDVIDEQSGSGKLDVIIQLPYVIKTEARKQQAEIRRRDLEQQLANSKFGIGYTDGTERITQLNRPAENNLMKQIEYLTSMLYSQLGITESILNGTASESEMLNYMARTIEPILSAIVDEFKRKFLTKTARTQRQSIMFFKDVFRLVPADKLADVADKFTRNEIMSSNEIRGVIGLKPSNDPRADELRNKNLNAPTEQNTELNDQLLEQEVEELRIANEQARQLGAEPDEQQQTEGRNSQNGRKT